MYKIHIGCLPPSTSARDLKAAFREFGKVLDVRIRRGDFKTGSDSATLVCGNEATYKKLLEIGTFAFQGRSVYCERVLTGDQILEKNRELAERRVFISNLPVHVTDEEIKVLFTRFGSVQAAYRIRGLDNHKKPFGYVSFFDKSSALRAIEQRKIHGWAKPIYVSSFQKNKPVAPLKKAVEGRNLKRSPQEPLWNMGISIPSSGFNHPEAISGYSHHRPEEANLKEFEFSTFPDQKNSSLTPSFNFFTKPTALEYHTSDRLRPNHQCLPANLRLNLRHIMYRP